MQEIAYGQDNSFIIKGKINPESEQSKVQIWYPDPTNVMGVKDSAVVRNGSFVIKGTFKIPGKAIMYTIPDRSDIELYIESDTIFVNSNESLSKAVVTAGPLNRDFTELTNKLRPVSQKLSELYKAYEIARKDLPADSDQREFEHTWDNKIAGVRAERKTVYIDFIQKMPKSIVSIEAIKSVGGMKPDVGELARLFESLDTVVKDSPSGRAYKEVLAKLLRTSIGATAPLFVQADTSGKRVSLTDFRGKYVLLDFWASWCGPCRAQHPNLTKVFNKYKDQNFTILGVSLDQVNGKEAWLKAIRKDQLAWTQLSDLKGWANEVSSLYNVEAIPKNYLIGPDGTIIAVDLKPEDLSEKLEKLAAGKP